MSEEKDDYKIFKILIYVITIGCIMIIATCVINLFLITPVLPTVIPKITKHAIYNYLNGFIVSIGLEFLLAGAAALFGAFLGFVFGIPQYKENLNNINFTSNIAFNNNLVQVSDWLTKIIVGVGLTQLNNIPSSLISYGKLLYKNDINILL